MEIPVLPESAPFTAEQRAYLNGFLAGLLSRAPVAVQTKTDGTRRTARPLTILFGSQTGTAEGLAKRARKEAQLRGFDVALQDLAALEPGSLTTLGTVLIIASTYGDGEPPDGARDFWKALTSDGAPRLEGLRYAVCSLGDSNYPKFCAFGRAIDARFAELGAAPVCDRADCDTDYELPFAAWLDRTLRFCEGASAHPTAANGRGGPLRVTIETETAMAPPGEADTRHSKSNPFPGRLVANRRLNGRGSAKDTRHFEISIAGSGMTYEAGDALGVFPQNCPDLVRELIHTMGCRGSEVVPGKGGCAMGFSEALLNHYEITRIPRALVALLAEQTGDVELRALASPDSNGTLTSFLRGREIIDLLSAWPSVRLKPEELVPLLRPLQPRLYSISSSPKLHPATVHLTTSVVRYETLGRARKGVCSTFLAERAAPDAHVPVFVHTNASFRLPSDSSRGVIMVGPGTGIAPFRAFLQERQAAGSTGRNWLFFGDQRAATDDLYRDELHAWKDTGLLTRLDTAFSRDQLEKVYVQTRMIEHARELFKWLEDGAHFYVCGDATRMAKDVDAALHEVIALGGGRSVEDAALYVERLRAERRYLRDVY